MKIHGFIAVLSLSLSLAFAADSALAAGIEAGRPCVDVCELSTIDNAPACDVLGLVVMAACIPDLAVSVGTFATVYGSTGGMAPGRTWHGGMFIAPLLKIPSGVAGSVNRVRIDPGRIIYV